MADGNGDERQAAAWERVEAKLDRLTENVGSQFADVRGRLDNVEDTLLRHGAMLDRHAEALTPLGQLMSTHAEALTSVIRTLDANRREVDAKLDRMSEELLGRYGEAVPRDLIAAQTMNDAKLAELERRVRLLEAAR